MERSNVVWAVLLAVSGLLACTGRVRAEGLSVPGLQAGKLTASSSSVPQVKISLLADQTGIVPGGTVDLAVRFIIPSGWHIYWKNAGESGLETKLVWHLPAGFSVGPTQFPMPICHVDEADTQTFILEGEPGILTTLTAPREAKPGEIAKIDVDVSWLACQHICVPGNEPLWLDLPVVAAADQAAPVHEDEFQSARSQLPLPAGQAKYIQHLHAVAAVDRVRPGDRFMVGVVFDVQSDYHVNSHTATEGLVPTDLFAEQTNGVQISRPIFPPGKTEETHGEKLSVYRGRTVMALPMQANRDLAGKELRLAGVLTYQACNDKSGVCYPPTGVEWSLMLPVADPGESVAQVNGGLFKDFRQAAGQPPTPGTTQPALSGFTLGSPIRATMVREHHSLAAWLALAVLAGLILNVTPCVLPVISIKVLSFVQQASESPARVFKLGLAFSLGMMIVFNILAIMATALGLVWGQHFQSPVFTIAMASIVFAFGLSMFGVFTLGVPQSVGSLAVRAEGEGYAGSIAKGALATVMGTPCLGPFLGPVLVWATAQPAPMVFLVFNTIGVGMVLPYVILTANPRWLRFVPKAGPWLTTFKQAMAFLLMGTVVYLLFILEGQLGGPAVVRTLMFLTGVALACWMIGRFITFNTPPGKRLAWILVALAVVAGTGLASFRRVHWSGAADGSALAAADANAPSGLGTRSGAEALHWTSFSLAKLTELTGQGKPVLLDVTARWCPNCQYNSAFVFNSAEVVKAIEEQGVAPMLADWTAQDKATGQLIEKLAPGASIPLAAIFPAGRPNEPIVMLGIVTRQQVIDNLARANLPRP